MYTETVVPTGGTTADAGVALDTLFCANHPAVETLLRCNRCGKPVCLKCVGLTDVGYRCKECLRTQQAVFYTATPLDYVLAFGICLVLTVVTLPLAAIVFDEVWMFSLFLALLAGPAAGGILAQGVRLVVRKRRGRYLQVVVVAAIAVAVLAVAALVWGATGYVLLWDLPTAAFILLAASTAYHTLR
jgi:hypothetical protein